MFVQKIPLAFFDILVEELPFQKCLQRHDNPTIDRLGTVGEEIVLDDLVQLFGKNQFGL
jgi:hypothetical protein